jgi:hypothetical protein
MALFRTPRERRYWGLAGALVLAIYVAAYFVQFLLDALRARGLLAIAVASLLAACAGAPLVFAARRRPGPGELALLALAGGLYLALLRDLPILQERIHLIEYGAIGGLLYAALCERWPDSRDDSERGPLASAEGPPSPPRRWRRPAPWAIVLATLAGWGDELVQGALPNRVYDLRDVLTNAEAAALLVMVLASRRWLRDRRARASGEAEASDPPRRR